MGVCVGGRGGCNDEDRWAVVRCRGSLNTDEGQTEGSLASGLLSIFLWSCCSSVLSAPLTFARKWCHHYLCITPSPLCLLSCLLHLLLSQWSKWTEEGPLPLQKTNWKVRMLCFYFSSDSVSKGAYLTHDLLFTGTHTAAPSSVGCRRLVA